MSETKETIIEKKPERINDTVLITLLSIGGAILALYIAVFWPMWVITKQAWMNKDGYYSHGVLVPIISGYLAWQIKDIIAKTKLAPSLWGLPLVIIGMLLAVHAKRIDSLVVFQAGFMTSLFGISLFILGKPLTRVLLVPLCFLVFMMPLPDVLFDTYTNPIQFMSTNVAYWYLKITGYNPIMPVTNEIYTNYYQLNIGVPCSGFKLSISLLTFCVFFMTIAKLPWWKNFILLQSIVPIALIVNGLRIAVIGMVGDTVSANYGMEAGQQWGTFTHDYSGYILLFLAFGILFGLAKILGWKKE